MVATGSGDWTARPWVAATGETRGTLECALCVVMSLFVISYLVTAPTSRYSSCLQTLFVSNNWVSEEKENILWLPPDYRSTCVAVWNGIVVLGYSSGGISFLEFKQGRKIL